ncbi:MAG: hypothetical protein QGH77_02630, partial [Planctomycetota bacterium]|nr:hypothetical protein [Planctomycetota bacterium]
MGSFRVFLAWFAPLLTLALVLILGRGCGPSALMDFNPPKMEASQLKDLPEPITIQLRLEKSDGSPAAGATLVALQPSLVSATVNRNGIASLVLTQKGSLEFMGWLTGHEVLHVTDWNEAKSETIRFIARDRGPLGTLPKLEERDIALQLLQSANQEPLAGALVLGKDAQEGPPWVAISDSTGRAVLKGTTKQLKTIQVYAPGLPPKTAWLLGSTPMDSLPNPWVLQTKTLVIEDAQPGEVLCFRKEPDGDLLPMKLFPESGFLSWGPLPEASYTL